MAKFQTARGTRDFMPDEMVKRQFVLDKVRSVFERWGFMPLETPAFEDWKLLSMKSGGGEAIKEEVYYFKDKSGRELGLRFDLTVPMARVVASKSIAKPFKRYQIGRVWRYDRPGAGRYREFWQADIDTVGSAAPEADAEIIACAACALEELGFSDFKIRISSRKMIEAALLELGVKTGAVADVFRSIDKLEKQGEGVVEKELLQKKIEKKVIKKILEFVGIKNIENVKTLKKNTLGREGIAEVCDVLDALGAYGYGKYASIDMSLVRGLDYYTGIVFEISFGGLSVAGGGRYDNMIKLYGGQSTPATGISLGIERIIEEMQRRKMIENLQSTKAFIAIINEKLNSKAIEIASQLRKEKISCEIEVAGRPISKQLSYASARGIPFVIIVGEKELAKQCVKLRNMKTGEEKDVEISMLANVLKKHVV